MNKSPKGFVLTLTMIFLALPSFANWDEGVAAFQAGQYEEAAEVFRTVVSRSPEAPQGHYMLGLSLQRQKRLAEAEAALAKAVELGASEVKYTLSLAQLRIQVKRPDAALASLAAVETSAVPATMKKTFYQLLAKAADGSRRNAEALAGLERVLKVDPTSKTLWLAAANVAQRLGRSDRRFVCLTEAFKIDPADPKPGVRAVQAAISIAQAEAPDSEGKKEWYRKASGVGRTLVAAFPTPENLTLVGGAEMGAHEYEAAAASFERVFVSGGDDRLLHYYLGRSYVPLGRYEDALSHLQLALDRPGDSELTPSIHAARGLALRHLEDFDRAAQAFHAAGDVEQAKEMSGYAANRREWAAAKADCAEKRTQIAGLKEDSAGLEDSPEWTELEREFSEVLAACEVYFQDQG